MSQKNDLVGCAPCTPAHPAQSVDQTNTGPGLAGAESPPSTRLDPEPLLRAIEDRGGLHSLFPKADRRTSNQSGLKTIDGSRPRIAPEHLTRFNTMRDQLRRSRVRGWISYDVADRICVTALGVHPYVVFGPVWWGSEEEGEGDE